MDFELKYRRGQKRIHFRLDGANRLVVSAPPGYPRSRVEKILELNRDLIERLRGKISARPQLTGTEQDILFLLGQQYPLKFTAVPPFFQQAFYVRPGGRDEVLLQLAGIYWDLAAEMFPKFMMAAEEKTGLRGRRLRISSAAGRWGSCSAAGSINISWRTLQLPPHLTEYVFIHELTHLKEMNHSPKFKALLASFLPDYAAREQEINEWSRKLPRW